MATVTINTDITTNFLINNNVALTISHFINLSQKIHRGSRLAQEDYERQGREGWSKYDEVGELEVHTYIRTYVHTRIHACLHAHICIYTHIYICMCILCVYVLFCVFILYIYVYVCVYVCIFKQILHEGFRSPVYLLRVYIHRTSIYGLFLRMFK
jgi:hypothetical protein